MIQRLVTLWEKSPRLAILRRLSNELNADTLRRDWFNPFRTGIGTVNGCQIYTQSYRYSIEPTLIVQGMLTVYRQSLMCTAFANMPIISSDPRHKSTKKEADRQLRIDRPAPPPATLVYDAQVAYRWLSSGARHEVSFVRRRVKDGRVRGGLQWHRPQRQLSAGRPAAAVSSSHRSRQHLPPGLFRWSRGQAGRQHVHRHGGPQRPDPAADRGSEPNRRRHGAPQP